LRFPSVRCGVYTSIQLCAMSHLDVVMSSPAVTPQLISLEAYGVRFALGSSEPELFERLAEVMPPGARPCPPDAVEHTLLLLREPEGYRVQFTEGGGAFSCRDLEHALAMMDGQMRVHVATHAPDRFFINAGVVAVNEHAIVLPGISLTGKSKLVAALVDCGAVYYSDEYAVLDAHGLVHPFARSLRVRGEPPRLPTERGGDPVPVAVVARLPYRSGAELRTAQLSSAEGIVMLMEHALTAIDRPAETLAVLRRLCEHALLIDGVRGEAEAAAGFLLDTASELGETVIPDSRA
jgi:hypothetical protein